MLVCSPLSKFLTPFMKFWKYGAHSFSRGKHASDVDHVQSFCRCAWLILVSRAHDPSGLWKGSRALAVPNFLSMRRVFVSYSQPIRFARYDGKSVNCRLTVLDQTRALDPCHRPEGSWALGTRMCLARPDFLSMHRVFVSSS